MHSELKDNQAWPDMTFTHMYLSETLG